MQHVRMAAVATADTDLRKGNGSPLVLATERDTSMSQIQNCSALTTYYCTPAGRDGAGAP